MDLSYAQAVWLAKHFGFPDPHLAAAVGMAESEGDTDAINDENTDGSIDRGFFQINSIHGRLSTTNLVQNFRSALKVSGGGRNWSPWVQFNNGAYKDHLDRSVKPQPVDIAGLGKGAGGGGATILGTPASSGGEVFGEEERSEALKGLLWVAFVLGAAAMLWLGFGRAFGAGG